MPEPKPKQVRNTKGIEGHKFVKGHDPRRFVMVPRLARITDMKRRLLAKSGMTPLDFLTAVYRDELYDDYEPQQFTEVADAKLLPYARVWKPTDTARRIKLNLDQRITAANQAAPYFHSKRPVQLNVGTPGDELPQITKEQMRNMTPEELRAIIHAGELLGALPRAAVKPSHAQLTGTVTVIDDDGTIRTVERD